ncbi:hypothetical protein PISMIDRAFT_17379 [Pisolithus microcarpus 441]|uniref:Uncharacterized protein n=1 Tax=Pisolithus microcarpus 441 TaxID=765257 RepID=A0A0C9YVT6_9AGAM|nr:hypothetical protein PISMIDRAFT_17379 [Pisolithus microcarpus 441]
MLADSRGQHGEHEAKRPRHSPAPPAPSPNGILDMPTPFTDLRRRGRLKTKAENVSNACSRRNAYRARAALMWPPPPLFTPSKWLGYLMGGSWIVTVRYNKVRHVIRVKTRGYTHRGSHTSVSLPHKVLQRLRNISNTLWWQGVPPVSTLNDARWPTNLPVAKRLPVSSGTRRDDKHRAKWPNGLPAPSKPAQIDFVHTPGTLREPHRRGRIKTRSKNVSTVETRGAKASILPIPTSPPCDISQHLWNVANTYWRHGIPPGWTCNIKIPSLFETAALRQRYKARGCVRTKRIPEMAVATTRSTATATSQHLALHKDSKLHLQKLHSFI